MVDLDQEGRLDRLVGDESGERADGPGECGSVEGGTDPVDPATRRPEGRPERGLESCQVLGLEPGLEPGGEVRVPGEGAAEDPLERGFEDRLAVGLVLAEESAAVEGVLEEDPLAEGVDRVDRRHVEGGQGSPDLLARGGVDPPGPPAVDLAGGRSGQDALEHPADARPELVRRLVGEGDDEDLLDRDVGREEEVDDQVFDRVRLPRPGRGLDQGRPVEREVVEDRGSGMERRARRGHSTRGWR